VKPSDRGERCGMERVAVPPGFASPAGPRRRTLLGGAGRMRRWGMASSGGSREGGGASPRPGVGGRPAEPTGARSGGTAASPQRHPLRALSVSGSRGIFAGVRHGASTVPRSLEGRSLPATRPCHRLRSLRAGRRAAGRALLDCGAAWNGCTGAPHERQIARCECVGLGAIRRSAAGPARRNLSPQTLQARISPRRCGPGARSGCAR
jgi:hypothetical protein